MTWSAYTGKVTKPGLNLLSAPGNDGVAVTALAASGCHMVAVHHRSRHAARRCRSHHEDRHQQRLASRKPHWIDFDAGPIATGETTVSGLRDSFAEAVLDIASGKPTKNETNDIGEIVIFKTGVTL